MTIKEFFSFNQNKYFWVNLIAMTVVVVGILFGVLKGLDIYTRHGQAIVVPNIKGMGMDEAAKVLRNNNLNYVVADSGYVKNMPAGCVLDYNPTAGQKVKEGRTLYLTINGLATPMRQVPDVADNSSMRQAQARILASGFKLAENEYVSGEKDWVYGVKYKGQPLSGGVKIPVGATLTLMVGYGGDMPQETDSLGLDEGTTTEEGAAATPASGNDKSATDESWF